MPKLPPGVFKRETNNGKTRYAVRVYDSNATGNQRWVGTYDTLREASRAKQDAMRQPKLSGALTVREWSVQWLEECPRCEGTMRAYVYATKPLVDRFGGRQIRSITEADGNSFMVSSPKNAGDVARVMFSDARRLGLIDRNPFEGHRRALPSMRRPTLPVRAELGALIRASVAVHGPVYGRHFGAMIEVAAWTALRPGELFALCMQQVDLERNTINVDRQLLRSGCLAPPKQRRHSQIGLAPRARRALLAHAPADACQNVFQTLARTPFSQSKLHYYWHPVRVAAGLPNLHFRDLRHFCATQLVEAGVLPCDVAIQLGHCDNGELVMKHYLNPNEERARRHILAVFRDLDDDEPPAPCGEPRGTPRPPAPGTSSAHV